MTIEQKMVLNGLMNLSSDERDEVIEIVKKIDNITLPEQRTFSKSLRESYKLGPLSSVVCPSCGK